MYSNHRTTSHYWKSFEPFLIKMTLIMYLFITTFYNHYKHCSGLKDSRSSALYVLFSKQQWVNMTITIWRYDNEATWQYSWSLSDVLYDPLWSSLWSRHERKMLSWSRHFLLSSFFDILRWVPLDKIYGGKIGETGRVVCCLHGSNHQSYLIFVICSPHMQFLVQFFST